jgi:hypothetical protein
MLKHSAGIKKCKSATGEKMYPFTMEWITSLRRRHSDKSRKKTSFSIKENLFKDIKLCRTKIEPQACFASWTGYEMQVFLQQRSLGSWMLVQGSPCSHWIVPNLSPQASQTLDF